MHDAAAPHHPDEPRRSRRARRYAVAALRYAGVSVLVTLAVAIVAVAALALYLDSGAPKTFEEVAWLNGGSLEFRRLRLTGLGDYPHIGLRATGVRVSDGPLDGDGAGDVLRLGHLELSLRADPRGDTLAVVDRLVIRGGGLAVRTGADGVSNLDRVRDREGPAPDGSTPDRGSRVTLAPDAEVLLEDFRFDLENPARGTDVGALVERLRVRDLRRDSAFAATLLLDAQVDGIQFKAAEGPYLRDGVLSGRIDVALADQLLTAEAPDLRIGDNRVDFAARYYADRADTSVLTFRIDSTRVPAARAVLTDKLRGDLDGFHVDGVFASATALRHTFRPGDRPIVTVDLSLPGNRATVQGQAFADSYVRGRVVNRLPGHDTHAADHPRGLRFEVDTAATSLEGFRVRTGGALVTSPRGRGAYLRGRAVIEGPAAAASAVVGSREFVFTEGTVRADADLRGPTGDLTALIIRSDADVAFRDAVVELTDAGVRLPLDAIAIAKRGADAAFRIDGATPGKRHRFRLDGDLAAFEALLRADAPNEVSSRVTLTAPHLDWRDLVEILGGEDPLADDDDAGKSVDTLADRARKATLKSVLRLVESTFDPELDIAVDTLAYYGFELYDFATGLDFEQAGAVVRLEESRFRVDTGTVAFDGVLDISLPGTTPFDFAVEARHLNLADLLPEVDYFGQELLADVGTLPDDVDVTVFQHGVIDDVLGLLPNQSEGSIEVVSHGDRPFEASIDFEPDRPGEPTFNSAHVELSGSPELFNGFFATERFFFSGGRFDFWLDYAGRVPTVRALLDHEDMGVSVSRTGVRFAGLDATLPVTRLDVAVSNDTGEVSIVVRDDELAQEIRVEGLARNVSEIVYGGTGERFSSEVTITSPRLVWSDLAALIGTFSDGVDPLDGDGGLAFLGTPAKTSRPTPAPGIRRGVRELLSEFHPRARLAIDELQLTGGLTVDSVAGGLWMDADSVLHLDTAGFAYRGGGVEVAGTLDLADLTATPFVAHVDADALDVPGLLEGLGHLDVQTLEDLERFEGQLRARGRLRGVVADRGGLVPASLHGAVDVAVRDLAVAGLAPVDSLRSRFGLLDERLAALEFAPIRTRVAVDSGVVRIPFTEIQSNAVGFWLEGEIAPGGDVDLWATLPLAELRRGGYDEVPALRGSAVPRLRAHVQLATDEEGGLSPKLRLSRRAFYRDRGLRERRRADRRRWRAARRD